MPEFKIQQHPNLIVAIAPIRLMGVEQFIAVSELKSSRGTPLPFFRAT